MKETYHKRQHKKTSFYSLMWLESAEFKYKVAVFVFFFSHYLPIFKIKKYISIIPFQIYHYFLLFY